MTRAVLSLVALVSLFALQPAAALAQAKAKPSGTPPKTGAAVMVNINTASASEFEALPGIGAKTAARIIEYRQKNGPFKKVEEILEISRFCR